MMTIKVNLKDDYIITRINGTLREIAEHYFSQPGVESIDILEGGKVQENEYLTRTIIKIYRVSPEEIKEFDLYYNIRAAYKVEYKPEYQTEYKDREESCGFLRIAQPKRSEMTVRAGCRRCAEDGRQKGKQK